MPGPLPDPHRQRRNAPTIPTTNLPASGRPGRVPSVPSPAKLGGAGKAWWRWAWHTPQAAAWDAGSHQLIARRASLEDELAEDGGRVAVLREMRELDDRLGLSPKGLAALRWVIVDDTPAQSSSTSGAAPDEVAARRSRRDRVAAGE